MRTCDTFHEDPRLVNNVDANMTKNYSVSEKWKTALNSQNYYKFKLFKIIY